MTYLDNAATSFPKPEEVYREMDRVGRTLSVNTGRGSYRAAREAQGIVDDTRKKLLSLFHAEGIGQAFFAPSVTHAINQVLRGLEIREDSIIYESPYEHNAVARTIEDIRKATGCSVRMLPLTDSLEIDLEKTRYLFLS